MAVFFGSVFSSGHNKFGRLFNKKISLLTAVFLFSVASPLAVLAISNSSVADDNDTQQSNDTAKNTSFKQNIGVKTNHSTSIKVSTQANQSNTSNPSNVNVSINGQEIEVPENSDVNKTIKSEDRTGYIDINIHSSSSLAGDSGQSSNSRSFRLKTSSRSNSSTSSSSSVDITNKE